MVCFVVVITKLQSILFIKDLIASVAFKHVHLRKEHVLIGCKRDMFDVKHSKFGVGLAVVNLICFVSTKYPF